MGPDVQQCGEKALLDMECTSGGMAEVLWHM